MVSKIKGILAKLAQHSRTQEASGDWAEYL